MQSLPSPPSASTAPNPAVCPDEPINLAGACAELLEADAEGLPVKVTRWIEDWTLDRDRLPGALSAMHQRQLTESESRLAVASLLRVAAQRSGIDLPVAATA